MKVLRDEYLYCTGKEHVFCDGCEDKRIKVVVTYEQGEVITSMNGMGKNCIESSRTSCSIGGVLGEDIRIHE